MTASLTKRQQALAAKPVAALGPMSQRVLRRLEDLGVVTVGDLIACTPSNLCGTRGFGRVALAEVQVALARHRLTLTPDPPKPRVKWWLVPLAERRAAEQARRDACRIPGITFHIALGGSPRDVPMIRLDHQPTPPMTS